MSPALASGDPPVGYRRRIRIEPAPGSVTVRMEDDFHRFELSLSLRGDRIEQVHGRTDRTPWFVCRHALEHLADRLRGQSLQQVRAWGADGSHCTHLLDLAVLGAGHADDGRASQIDMAVSEARGGVQVAELRVDGALELRWEFSGETLIGPAPFTGWGLRRVRQSIADLPPAVAERALMLRRACFVSRGRDLATEVIADLEGYRRKRQGACFTYSGERLQEAVRRPGWRKDFARRPDLLLAASEPDGTP